MGDTSVFADLLERVRGADSDAAIELVRKYKSAIRVVVRTRLSDPALRRQFDSMDVCQSVLGSFFRGAENGLLNCCQRRGGCPRRLRRGTRRIVPVGIGSKTAASPIWLSWTAFQVRGCERSFLGLV